MNEFSAFLFRALKNKNYRLFFTGQSISLVGTWMQQVALSWLVYRMSNSALLLGIVGFSGQLPGFFLTPFAGIFADRYNRHRMIITTQTLAMVQALVLAVLVLSNSIAVWHIITLSVFLGLVNAFDIPVRQAFTLDMLEQKEDLGNAIALNSTTFNIARLIGPSVAGILIASVGEGICFLINAFSFLAVLTSLLLMRIVPKEKRPAQNHFFREFKEGFLYTFGFPPIKILLFILAMMSLTGVSCNVLMPIFAHDIFHGDSRTLGILLSMTGLGALAGAVYLALQKNILGLGKVISVTMGFFGVGMIILSLSKILWISMIALLMCGFGMMVQMASCNTIVQTIADDDKRGRVMGFYALAFLGTVPFGSLLAGSLAHTIGAPLTFFLSGACCFMAAVVFAQQLPSFKKQVRPIYVKKGIIDEV